jgi:hypothetical protein
LVPHRPTNAVNIAGENLILLGLASMAQLSSHPSSGDARHFQHGGPASSGWMWQGLFFFTFLVAYFLCPKKQNKKNKKRWWWAPGGVLVESWWMLVRCHNDCGGVEELRLSDGVTRYRLMSQSNRPVSLS